MAWADPGEDPDDGICQVVFDCPDAARNADLRLPALATAQIAAFAGSIEVHKSPEAFAQTQEGQDPPFASQSFMPSGLFSEDGDASEAIFAGHAVESSIRTNSLTGEHYVWVAVETLGGTYDVVADPALLPESPTSGAVVLGSFWLSGRLLGEPVEVERAAVEPMVEKRGFFRRLFG